MEPVVACAEACKLPANSATGSKITLSFLIDIEHSISDPHRERRLVRTDVQTTTICGAPIELRSQRGNSLNCLPGVEPSFHLQVSIGRIRTELSLQ
jgi:hypothetical protein